MANKMRSHDRTFSTTTAPRLNFRQSTILTTPVDKSNSSSTVSSPSSVVEEPYCAAASAGSPSQLLLPPPAATKASAVTNKPTHDVDSDTPSTLLLRKATTSQSSMNLTTLLENCQDAPLLEEATIIPRPSQSAPYATSSSSSSSSPSSPPREQQQQSDTTPGNKENDDDMTGGPWHTLQARLMDIITTTIHQELARHATPVSHQQHVALEQMVTEQQKTCSKTLALIDCRLASLEQQQQQQSRDFARDGENYNALHARYMDLVTQHSQQVEKYQQLERAHQQQLEQQHQQQQQLLQQTQQKKKKSPPVDRPMLPTPNASPTNLPSPDLTPVKMDNGYVEFMTECNGRPVLCRVKLRKDADVRSPTANKVSGPSSSPQQQQYQQRHHNHHHYQKKQQHHQHQQHQQRYQPITSRQQTSARYQPPQQQYQQPQQYQQQHQPTRQQSTQQQHYHYHPQYPQQTYHHHSSDDLHSKSLNPHAPIWTGSWKKQKQLHYYQ